MARIERRRFPRVMTPVFYRTIKLATPRRRVINLSLRGVRIDSDEPLAVGQVLKLEFFFPNGKAREVVARVVWIRKQQPGSGGVYDVGMEFTDLSEAALKELRAVLKRN
jgi:hypothetical protein